MKVIKSAIITTEDGRKINLIKDLSVKRKELDRRIESIPGQLGWWNSSARDNFVKWGDKLLEAGWMVDNAAELLESLYRAAVRQYGE